VKCCDKPGAHVAGHRAGTVECGWCGDVVSEDATYAMRLAADEANNVDRVAYGTVTLAARRQS
jgi:hypothetical protein